MDRNRVQGTVQNHLDTLLSMSRESVAGVVEAAFTVAPLLQIRGSRELHPAFGISLGRDAVTGQLEHFLDAVEVEHVEHQHSLITGLGASAHLDLRLRHRTTRSVCNVEAVALVELDGDGRVRELKLFFDTATFLKGANSTDATFTDVRSPRILPPPQSDGQAGTAAIVARAYDTLLALGAGRADLQALLAHFSNDIEIVFKSNPDVVPYAGHYANGEGLQDFFTRLFSTFSMGTLDFIRCYAEGDEADFLVIEPHYFLNPDGSRRYLDIHIVQSWRVGEDGRIRRFTSYNDSAWMDETFNVTQAYRQRYGYPESYPTPAIALLPKL